MNRQFVANIPRIHSRFTEPHGWLLYGLVRSLRPKLIVETGTCWGYVTAFLAAGVADNGEGRLVSIDHYSNCHPHTDASSMPVVEANLSACGVREWVELVNGEALETLKSLGASGQLEGLGLAILDDDHSYCQVSQEMDAIWPHVEPLGVVGGHDVAAFEGPHEAFRGAAERFDAESLWSPNSYGYCLMQKRSPADLDAMGRRCGPD